MIDVQYVYKFVKKKPVMIKRRNSYVKIKNSEKD